MTNDLNQIINQFSKFPTQNDDDFFLKQLLEAVLELLNTQKPSNLMHIFYRLDLPEEKTQQIMAQKSLEIRARQLTDLIYDRLKQKHQTRKQS